MLRVPEQFLFLFLNNSSNRSRNHDVLHIIGYFIFNFSSFSIKKGGNERKEEREIKQINLTG